MSDDYNPAAGGNAAPPSPPLPPASIGRGISGERHVSEVAGRDPIVSKKAGIGVIIAGAAIAGGVILLSSTRPNLKQNDGPKLAVQPQVQYVPPPPPPPASVATPVPVPPAPAHPPQEQPKIAHAPTDAAPRSQDRLLVYTTGAANSHDSGVGAGLTMLPSSLSGDANAASLASMGLPGGGGASTALAALGGAFGGSGEQKGAKLESRLTPAQLTGVSAALLPHQPFLLTMGTMIPCILQTAMDSTLPGLVTCVIPQDIFGKTGLTLLDRGTRVVGEFKADNTQGVERMFVVWTRAETPQGVVISLDSPATDPLGRSGMDGEVDRHFWRRFGGALLLTMVDGAIKAGIAEVSKSGQTTIDTSSTESVITESLRGSINIPPTIRKNQGALISILVARDLDFSTVYEVRPSPRRLVRAPGNRGWVTQ